MRLFGRPPVAPRYTTLSPRHAEACAILHAEAFAQGWSALDFERLIAARSSWSDAALDGRTGSLVGFLLSRAAADEAEILTVVVDRAWQRRGIGRELIERHVGQLARGGMDALFLEVSEDNPAARSLYAGTGFGEVGRREAYYRPRGGGSPVAALVLRRSIR